ncbi:hypothetical protein M5K25_009004 [Dendrobium thyrsiflorum]|uniref:Uncharacterized protein n=1 Tax=Dendrobium thyrsiflorum TaxID=117978 RepID=A0ABD0V4A7_DENTH
MHFSHLVRKQQRSSLPACPGLALNPALALHVMLARPSLPVCPVPACQCGQARFRVGPGQTGCQGQGSLPVTASPLIDSRIPLDHTSSESVVRRPGKAPRRAVPNPSPSQHAAARSRRECSSSSPQTAGGFGTGTPVPNPQSQSFSRSYGSILPTSLAYITPSTRGCSPWRPDAVMSTTGRGRHSALRIFRGRRGRTGRRSTCGALPAAGPYLRLSRFQGWQAVKQKR